MTFAREETGFKNINPSEPIAIEWTNRRLSKLSPVISYYFRIRRSPAKSFQQPVRLRHVFTSPSEVSDTIHHLQAEDSSHRLSKFYPEKQMQKVHAVSS